MEEMIVKDEELMDLLNEYSKAKEDSFVVLSMNDRVKLFLNLVKDCDYKKQSFIDVKEFKKLFFEEEALKRMQINNLENYFVTFVVGNKNTKENLLIALFNENGEKEITDKNTRAYAVSFKENAIKEVSVRELKGKILSGTYDICKCEKEDVKSEQNLKDSFKDYLNSTVRQA